MRRYRNSTGREVILIKTYRKHRNTELLVTYRPLDVNYDCVMPYQNFHDQFKPLSVAEVQS